MSHPPAHEYLFFHNQVLLGRNVSGFYHLQISNSGVYSCTPVNRAGIGESAAVNLTVVGRFTKWDVNNFNVKFLRLPLADLIDPTCTFTVSA